MRCVGRWSYGPSYDVTGRITDHDTTVYMARGSGVSVLQFHGGSQPSVTLLSDINAMGLVRRVVMQDSWLFVGTTGIEVYNVSQPTNPVKVSWTNATNNDLAVLGNYLYTTSNDSFKVFNISDKTSPSLVGAVRDSGSTVAVANGKAYLLWNTYGWGGMYILDVSNPQSPHRVGIWNGTLGSVAARGNLCYASDAGRFHILDMTNPASPQELSSVGVGGSVYVNGNFAYLSTFAVIDIMDSLSPGIVGQCSAGGNAVWTTGDYGYAFPLTGGPGDRGLYRPGSSARRIRPVCSATETRATSGSRAVTPLSPITCSARRYSMSPTRRIRSRLQTTTVRPRSPGATPLARAVPSRTWAGGAGIGGLGCT